MHIRTLNRCNNNNFTFNSNIILVYIEIRIYRAGLSTFEALGKSNLSGPHTNHHIVASQHAHTVLYCVCKQAWSLNYSYCVHTAVSAAYSILSL